MTYNTQQIVTHIRHKYVTTCLLRNMISRWSRNASIFVEMKYLVHVLLFLSLFTVFILGNKRYVTLHPYTSSFLGTTCVEMHVVDSSIQQHNSITCIKRCGLQYIIYFYCTYVETYSISHAIFQQCVIMHRYIATWIHIT